MCEIPDISIIKNRSSIDYYYAKKIEILYNMDNIDKANKEILAMLNERHYSLEGKNISKTILLKLGLSESRIYEDYINNTIFKLYREKGYVCDLKVINKNTLLSKNTINIIISW